MRVFGCVVASAFEATTATHPFGNAPTADFYWWGLPLIVTRPQVCICCFLSWKTHEQFHCSWGSFNEQWTMLHCSWFSSMNSGACSTVHGFFPWTVEHAPLFRSDRSGSTLKIY